MVITESHGQTFRHSPNSELSAITEYPRQPGWGNGASKRWNYDPEEPCNQNLDKMSSFDWFWDGKRAKTPRYEFQIAFTESAQGLKPLR
jgi:hypothetical protein